MDHPYDFRVPDFSGEVDAEAFLKATPEGATVKGLYFQTLLEMMAKLPPALAGGIVLERPRYLPFLDYPAA